jgi:hypothetical protein
MTLNAFAIICALFGIVLAVIGVRSLWRRRFFAGGTEFLFGGVLLAVASVLLVVSTNLYTYSRLTFEQPVADLILKSTGPQKYQATLIRTPTGAMQVFTLLGDEWQIDARVLKWRGWATMFGLDAQFRLERLSGRYLNIDMERSGARSVYALSDNPGLDLWSTAIDHPKWVPFVDAVYGSATFLPMADGARYRITLTQSGLIARPVNATATDAVEKWPASK